MTLRDYVRIIARQWIVVTVAVVIGLVTAGVMALAATPTYSASTQVLFSGRATTSGQDLAYAGRRAVPDRDVQAHRDVNECDGRGRHLAGIRQDAR